MENPKSLSRLPKTQNTLQNPNCSSCPAATPISPSRPGYRRSSNLPPTNPLILSKKLIVLKHLSYKTYPNTKANYVHKGFQKRRALQVPFLRRKRARKRGRRPEKIRKGGCSIRLRVFGWVKAAIKVCNKKEKTDLLPFLTKRFNWGLIDGIRERSLGKSANWWSKSSSEGGPTLIWPNPSFPLAQEIKCRENNDDGGGCGGVYSRASGLCLCGRVLGVKEEVKERRCGARVYGSVACVSSEEWPTMVQSLHSGWKQMLL